MLQVKTKKVISILIAAVLLLLCGCTPPNFTREKKNEIRNAGKTLAMEWLKENRPGSQMISVNAFGSVDLYSAVKGQFRYDGNKFTFVYDIANGTMYTDERFEEACTSIRDAAAVRLGLDPEKAVIYSFGMGFLTMSENDAPAQWATPAGEPIQTQTEKILPADADPELFAESVMSGEQEFVYRLDYYDNDFPIFDSKMLEICPSLSKVALHREITPGMTGVYSRTYAKDGIWQEYCHIEKLEDGLYGGWICSHEPEEDSLVFTRTGRKSFTVQIPAHTELVLLSEKEVRFVHTFSVSVNGKEKEIESELLPMFRVTELETAEHSVFIGEFIIRQNIVSAFRTGADYGGVLTIEEK